MHIAMKNVYTGRKEIEGSTTKADIGRNIQKGNNVKLMGICDYLVIVIFLKFLKLSSSTLSVFDQCFEVVD